MRDVTLVFLTTDTSICLAMKKKGFGQGKYNGIGGKVEEGETLRAAAVREVQEEVCVETEEQMLEYRAHITFTFENKPEWNQRMHVFFASDFDGIPESTDEMNPSWFSLDNIPYEEMWVDDAYWLPIVLQGVKIKASFNLTEDGSEILSHDIEEVVELEYENTLE